jgi:hypothetical protein
MTKSETLIDQLAKLYSKADEREQKSKFAIAQILDGLANYLEIPERNRIYGKPSEGVSAKRGQSPQHAAERQEDNTWAGVLFCETGGEHETSYQLGFTVYVDFQNDGPYFWTFRSEKRFRILTNDPVTAEPFFDHVYTHTLDLIAEEATNTGGRLPSRRIGFT